MQDQDSINAYNNIHSCPVINSLITLITPTSGIVAVE